MAETSDPRGRPDDAPPRLRRERRRRPFSPRRLSLDCFKFVGALVVLVAVGLGLFTARMSQGPIRIDGLGDKIAAALQDRFGRGAHFALGDTSLVQRGFGPSLTIDKLSITGPDGQAILSAPKAEVSVDPFALMFGKVVPRRLEVFDVTLRLALLKNGHLALAAGEGAKPFFEIGGHDDAPQPPPAAGEASPPPPPPPTAARRAVVVKEAGAALRQFMDVLTDPGSAIAAVDRLGISRGTLVIEDQVTDQVTTYKDLDLSFDRSHGKTIFGLAADGPSGRWAISALASGRPGTERAFSLKVDQLSIDELQFLSGSRSLGMETDMPIAATLDIKLEPDNELSEARGGFKMGPGFLRLGRSRPGAGVHHQLRWWLQLGRGGPDDRRSTRCAMSRAERISSSPARSSRRGARAMRGRSGWRRRSPACSRPTARASSRSRSRARWSTAASTWPKRPSCSTGFAVEADPGGITFKGTVDWIDGPHIRLGARIVPTPVATVQRAWPAFVASPVRAWIINRFEAGMVTSGTLTDRLRSTCARAHARRSRAAGQRDCARLHALEREAALPRRRAHARWHRGPRPYHRAHHAFLAGLGRDRRERPQDRGLERPLHRAERQRASDAGHPDRASRRQRRGGGRRADARRAEALCLDPARSHDPARTGRRHLGKDLLLGKGVTSAQAALSVDAKITHFVADHLVGKESLENADLSIKVADGALKAAGQGRIFGGPGHLRDRTASARGRRPRSSPRPSTMRPGRAWGCRRSPASPGR